jgi:hypothetical protein
MISTSFMICGRQQPWWRSHRAGQQHVRTYGRRRAPAKAGAAHRHGVHEVHADHSLWAGGGGGNLGDGDGGGVGGQNHARLCDLVQVAEELQLEVDVLRGRL